MAEYGVSLTDGPYDYNANIHVGWNSHTDSGKQNIYNKLFSQKTVNYISP